MNAIAAAVAWLAAHGATLLLGVTIVLAAGVLLTALQREPAARRRVGLSTALAIAVYLVAAVAPLPRWASAPDVRSTSPDALTPGIAAPVVDAEGAAHGAAPEPSAATVGAPTMPAPPAQRPAGRSDAPSTGRPVHEPEPAPGPDPAGRFVASIASPAGAGTFASSGWQGEGIGSCLAGLYLLGAALALLRTIVGFVRLRHLLARTTDAPQDLTAALRVAGARVRIARAPVRPFCAGLRRPVVVLPADLALPSRRSEALAVLRHEAAHLRHGDVRTQALLALLAIPLFCHPLFWWLCREVRFASELLADADAARGDRTGYARALLDFACREPQPAAANGIAVFDRPSDFYRRIQMLLQREGTFSNPVSGWRRAGQTLTAVAVAGAVSLVLGVPAPAQQVESPRPEARRPAPQEPRSADARTRELESTIVDMRNTIENLRDELARLRAAAPDARPPAAPPGADDAMQSRARAAALEALLQPPLRAADLEALLHARTPADEQPADALRALMAQGLYAEAQRQDPAPVPYRGRGSERANATHAVAELATRLLDLEAELVLAEPEARRAAELAKRAFTTEQEARRAQLRVETLRREIAIVRGLVEGEIRATEAELAWLDERERDATATEAAGIAVERERARARLEALHAVTARTVK